MAKKAKRRGRPPGSKNKQKTVRKNGAPEGMELGQLRSYIGGLQDLLARKVSQQRKIFENHLAELSGYTSTTAARSTKTATTNTRQGKRAKAKPKYQSKKDRSVKWSGRGMTPIWMRNEMKGTKFTKDDFLIKA